MSETNEELVDGIGRLSIHYDNSEEYYAIIIQKSIRGFLIRNKLRRLRDGMNFNLLIQCIKNYNETLYFEENMNEKLKHKKIRKTNLPSHITENIVKFAFFKKYKVMPSWDTTVGDLEINNSLSKVMRLEVKGSLCLENGGPSSFGPQEYWDRIYFVDGNQIKDLKFIVYEICLSSKDNDWINMKVSHTQTYKEQCNQKRRPRICFPHIISQIDRSKCSILFSGSIYDLHYD